jgi:hypothetical protein
LGILLLNTPSLIPILTLDLAISKRSLDQEDLLTGMR